MFTYEERTSIHLFKTFKEAQPRLGTLMSIMADFEITVSYMKDSPICVKSKCYYPVKKEPELTPMLGTQGRLGDNVKL